MAFLKSSKTPSSQKKYLFDSVFSQTQLSRHYIVQLVFSTIITTLGLVTGNIVVVIGAMLISPLFWPVLGMALGIITSRKHILKDATISFAASLVIVLFFSSLVTIIVPFNEISPTIISSVNPTIIDLFIALAVSTIGIFALYYPTISATTAGVAISISLLPPLSIAGIGIALKSTTLIGKSILLFGTNAGAIIFMGVIVLYLLNIRPRKAEEEVRFKYGILISGLLMILLSIPLTFYLRDSINQNVITSDINKIVNQEIKSINGQARVEKLNIDFLSLKSGTPLEVDATVYFPEGVNMTQKQREDLINKISFKTNKEVNLNFNIISTLSLQTEEDKQKSQLRKTIREMISQYFEKYPKDVVVDNVDISFGSDVNNPGTKTADIVIQIKQYGISPLSYEDLQYLKSQIEEKTKLSANLDMELIPVNRIEDSNVGYGVYELIETGTKSILSGISPAIELESLSIKGSYVSMKLLVPNGIYISPKNEEDIKSLARDALKDENINLNLQIIRFESR